MFEICDPVSKQRILLFAAFPHAFCYGAVGVVVLAEAIEPAELVVALVVVTVAENCPTKAMWQAICKHTLIYGVWDCLPPKAIRS